MKTRKEHEGLKKVTELSTKELINCYGGKKVYFIFVNGELRIYYK